MCIDILISYHPSLLVNLPLTGTDRISKNHSILTIEHFTFHHHQLIDEMYLPKTPGHDKMPRDSILLHWFSLWHRSVLEVRMDDDGHDDVSIRARGGRERKLGSGSKNIVTQQYQMVLEFLEDILLPLSWAWCLLRWQYFPLEYAILHVEVSKVEKGSEMKKFNEFGGSKREKMKWVTDDIENIYLFVVWGNFIARRGCDSTWFPWRLRWRWSRRHPWSVHFPSPTKLTI